MTQRLNNYITTKLLRQFGPTPPASAQRQRQRRNKNNTTTTKHHDDIAVSQATPGIEEAAHLTSQVRVDVDMQRSFALASRSDATATAVAPLATPTIVQPALARPTLVQPTSARSAAAPAATLPRASGNVTAVPSRVPTLPTTNAHQQTGQSATPAISSGRLEGPWPLSQRGEK